MTWVDVPLTLSTDQRYGGRWTSLTGGGREWLWSHPDPDRQERRRRVRPGDPFVDAGGVEEAVPTVRGVPDHGDVWSRPWWGDGADGAGGAGAGGAGADGAGPDGAGPDGAGPDGAGPDGAGPDGSGISGVRCRLAGPDGWVTGALRRSVRREAGALRVDYAVDGPPGARFLHAVHALLDVGPAARLDVADAGPARVLRDDGDAGGGGREESVELDWPSGLDRLGPDDGTAVCVLLPGVRQAVVTDGDDRLIFDWTADDPTRCSLLLWRNLRGWPAEDPYRSIGVEPMVGRAADLGTAAGDDVVRLPATGRFGWSVTVRMTRQHRR